MIVAKAYSKPSAHLWAAHEPRQKLKKTCGDRQYFTSPTEWKLRGSRRFRRHGLSAAEMLWGIADVLRFGSLSSTIQPATSRSIADKQQAQAGFSPNLRLKRHRSFGQLRRFKCH